LLTEHPSGESGAGATAPFHSQKKTSAAGPDEGTRRGGDIIVKYNTNMSTLMDFRYKKSTGVSGTDAAASCTAMT
jgi:GTP-binding protein